MKASGRGSRRRCEQMEVADLSHSRSVAETSELPTAVGLAGSIPAVPAVVGPQPSYAALPVSFSYDTCGYTHSA